MKHNLHALLVAALIFVAQSFSVDAQTISTFENLTLAPDSYWDGADTPLGTSFTSGNAIFPNYYETEYGGYWASGWAYSNMQDSTTEGFTNMYSARPAIGYDNSPNYLVGQQGSVINFNEAAIGRTMLGCYITNGTFAAISMRDGDGYAKAFGGSTGNDPDWFKLTIRKWYGGAMTDDSVEFYLADYRFENNDQDYILKTWQWVDLSPLGNVDSLKFVISSSDAGPYGINTPTFFCMDNFTTADAGVSVPNIVAENSIVSIYPNPVAEIVNVDLSQLTDKNLHVKLSNINGQVLIDKETDSPRRIAFNLNEYPGGVYFVTISGDRTSIVRKLIKE